MIDNNYVQKLEHVIKQMLTPLKGIPFPLIIESICDKRSLSMTQAMLNIYQY